MAEKEYQHTPNEIEPHDLQKKLTALDLNEKDSDLLD